MNVNYLQLQVHAGQQSNVFFYNSQTGQCEEFNYGGCFGNENNFETIEECQETCDD